MTIYVARRGDCLSSLALRFGMKSWKQLFDHGPNAALREARRGPNHLEPGDQVHVPDADERWEERATGASHRFVVDIPKAKLRLAIHDDAGEPCADKRYVLTAGATTLEGKTDGEGLVETGIPADLRIAHLKVWLEAASDEPEIECDLAVGDLGSVKSIEGVQARLANLGFRCAVTGDLDDATRTAMSRFRARQRLSPQDPPDTMDDAFLDRLTAAHDGG